MPSERKTSFNHLGESFTSIPLITLAKKDGQLGVSLPTLKSLTKFPSSLYSGIFVSFLNKAAISLATLNKAKQSLLFASKFKSRITSSSPK